MIIVRWILAVLGGIVGYFVVILLALGVFQMNSDRLAQFMSPGAHGNVGRSMLFVSISIFLATFAGCLAAVAIAPHRNWRTMAAIAFVAGSAWAIYGQLQSGHPMNAMVIESAVGVVGAALAYLAARQLYGGRGR